jgi:hypothetical protein
MTISGDANLDVPGALVRRPRSLDSLPGPDISDLAETEVRILRLQIDTELAQWNRQRTMVAFPLLLRWAEQTCHAECIESIRNPSQRTFC